MNINEDVMTVIEKVAAYRAETKSKLTGIDLMQYNLFWRLRGWILRKTENECVNVGDIVEKIGKHAPKSILNSREQYERAVKDLWNSVHEYSIDSEDYLREDLEFEMDWIFNPETK